MEKKLSWNQYLYYIIIGVLSVITLLFVPMLGSGMALALVFPTTAAGWIVWSVSKAASVGLNLMIFHCFIKQARLNIADNPRYIAARDMLLTIDKKEEIPISPHEYFRGVYGKKGISLALTTLLSLIGFSQAILTFSAITFITQIVTMTIAVVFGIMQMKETEVWWCDDYYRYAKYQVQQQEKEKAQKEAIQNDSIQRITETSI